MDKKRDLSITLLSGAITLVMIFLMGFNYYTDKQKEKQAVEIDTIYKNIFINDTDIGGLTKDQAVEKLNKEFKDKTDKQIFIIKLDNTEFDIAIKQLQLNTDFSEIVQQAYEYARDGTISSRYRLIKNLNEEPKIIEYKGNINYNYELLKKSIEDLSVKIDYEATNATAKRVNNEFIYIDERTGRELNVEKTLELSKKEIETAQFKTVEAVINVLEPIYKLKDFEESKDLIGTSTTIFTDNDPGRTNNLLNATSKLDSIVVYPDEIFSTNNTFGEMSAQNGYDYAPVIVGGKFVDDLGGGICQVSSALYNAIMYAELKIIERQNHSMKVGYSDYGLDATLAGDYIDLKFQNDTKHPIYIESYANGNEIIINIYGQEIHDSTRKIRFEKALISTIVPELESIVKDDKLPLGERVVTEKERTGYKYEVYKIVEENGQVIDKALYNTSIYKAVRGEVTIGTGI